MSSVKELFVAVESALVVFPIFNRMPMRSLQGRLWGVKQRWRGAGAGWMLTICYSLRNVHPSSTWSPEDRHLIPCRLTPPLPLQWTFYGRYHCMGGANQVGFLTAIHLAIVHISKKLLLSTLQYNCGAAPHPPTGPQLWQRGRGSELTP